MKKSLLLGLTSLFLQSAVSLAQAPVPAPAVVAPVSPPVLEEVSSGPLIAWNNDPVQLPRVWGSSEVLMWWTKKVPVTTPLLTQALSTTDPTAGFLSSPNTAILLGGQRYDLGMRYGGRFTLGGWFDTEGCLGLEGNYLFISPRASTQSFGTPGTPGSPTLLIPFVNATTGMESARLVGGNGGVIAIPGNAFLHLSNQLQGAELNLLGRLIRTDNLSVNGLVGFRYVNFKEDLDFGTSLAIPPIRGFIPGGYALTTLDTFHARNNFYGGNLGLRGEYRLGNFYVEATGKVALGSMQQSVDVNGTSSQAVPGLPANLTYTNAPGGFFAQSTNIGHHTHNAFCVVPEAEVKLGYNITRNIQAFVGYNLLYLSNVARPGTTIDRNINTTQGPPTLFGFGFPGGPAAPAFSFHRSDFLAQGLNFGLGFKF